MAPKRLFLDANRPNFAINNNRRHHDHSLSIFRFSGAKTTSTAESECTFKRHPWRLVAVFVSPLLTPTTGNGNETDGSNNETQDNTKHWQTSCSHDFALSLPGT